MRQFRVGGDPFAQPAVALADHVADRPGLGTGVPAERNSGTSGQRLRTLLRPSEIDLVEADDLQDQARERRAPKRARP